jgi:DNA-binding NtrC family response regulator
VIAISVSKDASLPAQARALGAAEFLTKPVDLGRLTELLRRLLDRADGS